MGDSKDRLVKRLNMLWLVALCCGAAAFLGGLAWINSSGGPGFDWVWAVAAFGVAVVVYNGVFFGLCSVFVPGLSNLVEDDTEVRGDDVTHVVKHAETGDESMDFYIRNYAAARSVSAAAIVSVIVAGVAWTFF